MKLSTFNAALLGVAIEPDAANPAYLQLYEQLRDLILSGRLAPGDRLPSTRAFASELSLSRTTLVAAYDQLQSEGYLETRRGAGVFVAQFSPEHLLLVNAGVNADTPPKPRRRQKPAPPAPFAIRATSPADFPAQEWARLLQKTWRSPSGGLFREEDNAGDPELRFAIADHLRTWRGISCSADQVIVTSSSTEAVDLIIRAVCQPEDKVWLENPGYMPMRSEIIGNDLEPIYVPVDNEGLIVGEGEKLGLDARLAITTPPRQFPLGMTMSLNRRLSLLNWAREQSAWIIEDDYDSEFRYEGRPLAALMSMDETERVIYLGSFSKVMFKSLRLGYVVVPASLIETCREILAVRGTQASNVAQPALAEFMESGEFASHIRRMRRLYARRRACMLECLAEKCAGLLRVEPANSGMHVVVSLETKLAERLNDVSISRALADAGIVALPLSSFFADGTPDANVQQGLLLGFSGFEEHEITAATQTLATTLERL